MLRKPIALIVLALTAAAVTGCGGASDIAGAESSGGSGGGTQLSLVAYSTPQVVYDEIIAAYGEQAGGEGPGFKTSFGSSGEQSRAVEAGLEADIVAFSLEPDITRLVDAGLVADDWADAPHKGLASTSVVVFAVRKGNPKGIRTWDDLLEPGVDVVTPNPFTSGGAKWNLLAGFGAKGDRGQDPEAGLDFLRELITEHVKVQDKSAREALQTFLGGTGDVLLAYENEAITAQKKGEELDYVLPQDTILIETPIAVTTKAKPQAQEFLDFVLSPEGQKHFAEWGYRPVDETVGADFEEPSGLFTIRDLGGWEKVNAEMFDPEEGSVAKIEEEAGVSTAK